MSVISRANACVLEMEDMMWPDDTFPTCGVVVFGQAACAGAVEMNSQLTVDDQAFDVAVPES